jgi:hypothetical protein
MTGVPCRRETACALGAVKRTVTRQTLLAIKEDADKAVNFISMLLLILIGCC